MVKKSGKILLLLLISSLILFFNSDTSRSCGGDWWSADYMYSVFNERLINQPSLEPFLLSSYMFHPYEDSVFNEKKMNLVEWRKYFNNQVDTADIRMLLYPTTFDDLNEIFIKIKHRDYTSIDKKWQDNKLVKYFEKTKKTDPLEYITFAKKCEPLVSNYRYWEPPERDTSLMLNLIDEGILKTGNTNDNYLKLRYAFQVIRLAHYSGNYQKAVELYDKLVPRLNSSDMVKYWALSLKAGALKHLGNEAEANYYFSVVFNHCPSKRFTASLSFKITSDSSFKKSLSLCKNNQEKAALWAIAAYKNEGIELDAMKKIFQLKPDSPYLELLLAREVNRVERELLPDREYYWNNFRNYLRGNQYLDTKNNIKLTGFVQECARAGNTIHPYLWDLAAGYLMTLTGDAKNAGEYFDLAEKKWPGEDVSNLNKIRIFRIMDEINSLTDITPADENRILPDLEWLYRKSSESEVVNYTGSVSWFDKDEYKRNEGEAAFLFARIKLARLYSYKGDYVKFHLCMGDNRFNYNLDSDPEKEPIDAILSFLDKPDKTKYERFLVSIYNQSKENLLSLKGMIFINRHNFKEAVNVYSQLSRSPEMSADPFSIRLNDCHDCDYRETGHKKYTVLQFAERMLEMDTLARTNSDSAAEYYFLLGNGLYNISYFGNCWSSASKNRDFDYYPYAYYNDRKNWRFYDCAEALINYEKAMHLAKDREFAAKCCFMAAKCEQNAFYNGLYKMNLKKENDYKRMKLKYRTFFKKLKQDYEDTGFYNEALKECRYFNSFVKLYN
jgi:hypothetical protein